MGIIVTTSRGIIRNLKFYSINKKKIVINYY